MTLVPARFTFLGSGGSMGIPVIGCHCEVCQSTSPYNKRLRPSALLQVGDQNLLIDCGPDFRSQALQHHIEHIEGIIFTHAHYDHTGGVDDLRIFCIRTGKPIPCLLSKHTLKELESRFYYVFEKAQNFVVTTKFDLQILEAERGEVVFQGLRMDYFSYEQMGMEVNGFRFGNMAYVSDIRNYPETIFEDLKGVEILVLSALRFGSSVGHFSIDEAVDFAKRVGPRKTWLMHVAHELDHDKANAYLPENIRVAYDGLALDFLAVKA